MNFDLTVRLTEKQRSALLALPLTRHQWSSKVHANTRRSLESKKLVVQDSNTTMVRCTQAGICAIWTDENGYFGPDTKYLIRVAELESALLEIRRALWLKQYGTEGVLERIDFLTGKTQHVATRWLWLAERGSCLLIKKKRI